MPDSISLFVLLLLLFLLPLSLSQSPPPPPRGLRIDCGATDSTTNIAGLEWLPDSSYISTGTPKAVNASVGDPVLSTVRSFPYQNNLYRKFCYVVPVFRTGKYLIRTTYFYGGVNGVDSPPVFDQIVEGTFWSVVNTTEDYAKGNASYYEGVFVAGGKAMSVCLAANTYTDSDMFISALEFVLLADSVYNSTDFGKYALKLAARHSFGYNGSIIQYPEDEFDRYWEPFGKNNPTSAQNVSVSGFWNLPPLKIFQTQMTSAQPEILELQWPPISLMPSNSYYYLALYFADESGISRTFNVSINGFPFYNNLNVIPSGVVLFANQWPLQGYTKITLTPVANSTAGPLINAGEVFEVLLLGGRTLTRDVTALESVKNSFQNPPIDWSGDPCLPKLYSWTGVTCSEGSRVRVVALNLTGLNLSGSISPSFSNLTALTDIWLGNNSLSGPVPDLSSLRLLETVHLEDNNLSGGIPPSLGNISSLHELFLQNNNFTGDVPSSLVGKPGLNLRISPGNPHLVRPNS